MPDNDRSRPGERAAPNVINSCDTSIIREQRRSWANILIRRSLSPVPSYGSPAWLTLQDADPAKVAACVVAAECWAVDGDEIVVNLQRELAAVWHAEKRIEDEQFRENAAEHRRVWGKQKLCRGSFVDYVRRQSETEVA